MPSTGTIEAVLQRHGYLPLPAPLEGTSPAVFHHESNGTACADVLVYRETNGSGEALKNEAALLVEALPRIGQRLRRHPDLLLPRAQAHAVVFLGRKVHVLVGGDGRPLRCRLFPLLVISGTISSETAAKSGDANLPVIPANQLERYMSRQRQATSPELPAIDAWLLHFRRAHQLLGTAFLTFPTLLGLSPLLASLGWLPAGLLSFIIAALSLPTLLLAGLRQFRRFGSENPSGVLGAPEPSDSAPTSWTHDSIAHTDYSINSVPTLDEAEPTAWTPAHTASFLSDSMQSAMAACLSAYEAANWRACTGYLNSLLINGLRLAILKRTGRTPPQQTDELLDQLPQTHAGSELDAWLRRLAAARQTQPLSMSETQQAAHFSVQLLRELAVMPATWAAQILQIVPRPSRNAVSASSLGHLTPTAGTASIVNTRSRSSPQLELANAATPLKASACERTLMVLVRTEETTEGQNSTMPMTTAPPVSKRSEAVDEAE